MRTTAAVALLALPALCQQENPGYTDTPVLPDGFCVHDSRRPRPPVVDPGPGPAKPAPAPADAVVLFDGSSLDAWRGRKGAAAWKLVDGGAMEVTRTGDIRTAEEFGDCQLHIEWMAPPPKGHSQGRGNSGVFFFGRYEVQVLDSFENPTYADGQAAAIYGQKPPYVNVTRPPGQWNVYDIVFVAPRFTEDGAVQSPARLAVVHNGVVVQLDLSLPKGMDEVLVARWPNGTKTPDYTVWTDEAGDPFCKVGPAGDRSLVLVGPRSAGSD